MGWLPRIVKRKNVAGVPGKQPVDAEPGKSLEEQGQVHTGSFVAQVPEENPVYPEGEEGPRPARSFSALSAEEEPDVADSAKELEEQDQVHTGSFVAQRVEEDPVYTDGEEDPRPARSFIALSPGEEPDVANSPKELEEQDQVAGGSCFALLVEDDMPIQRLEKVILEEAGCEVRAVRSENEALRILTEESPALVMLDGDLLEGEDFMTCRRIRELSGAPLLFVSKLSGADRENRALAAGATAYVNKPFSPQKLIQKVRELLPIKQPTPESGFSLERHDSAEPIMGQCWGKSVDLLPMDAPSERQGAEVYEGSVQLVVTSGGGVGQLLNFVGELRQDPRLRLYRLNSDQNQECNDILLGLREPLPLKEVLLAMKDVTRVTIANSTANPEDEPRLTVVLGPK